MATRVARFGDIKIAVEAAIGEGFGNGTRGGRMKLKLLIAALLLFAGYALGQTKQQSIFYVTFPYAIPARTAVKLQFVKEFPASYDREEALTHMSLTVWTEKEWKECSICQSFGPTKTVEELMRDTKPY